ncbi:alkylated DNA repair protein ALKBH8 homolog isoform X2 [Brachypodium distachyon]|uniref:alkylated DNA repair protein ALKBH8 homolog isoform X2 n=1 Tax=Brachypodium distachyon TaxID=15368 RepID=UPI000D0CC37D|nr:alkylated DNA repair protein ALKBH8 homolog isoform X2 [Brachypodium distachyon]|eukprot:XP_024319020.1 alkylated DNA repair protein ALKBH8 homolog isoform X2 [Brachypodium distachyon]
MVVDRNRVQGALHQFMAAAAASYDDDELRGRAALREAFGDSSESESDAPREEDPSPVGRGRWRWEAVAGVRGLWLCAAFLSADEQSRLLAAIQREGWFIDAHNQAMRFGDLPPWAVELSVLVREAICVGDVNVDFGPDSSEENEDSCPLPSDLLWREPLFDQLIANRYKPVSLESACVMHFSQESTAYDMLKNDESEFTNVPVYLSPGSLVVMSGDARYHWKHEINRKPGAQIWNGQELEQHRRTSVTLRKLRASPN